MQMVMVLVFVSVGVSLSASGAGAGAGAGRAHDDDDDNDADGIPSDEAELRRDGNDAAGWRSHAVSRHHSELRRLVRAIFPLKRRQRALSWRVCEHKVKAPRVFPVA